VTAPWYRTPWFFVLVAAIALALFDVYFWFTLVPKPDDLAPGGWNSDSTMTVQAYVHWYLWVAAVPVLLVLAFLGPVFRRPARWLARIGAVLLLVAIEAVGFSILLLVGPYP
jgi:hypothetical protein